MADLPEQRGDLPCSHPSCDLLDGHDGYCPYKTGNCLYCGFSDCRGVKPECDGLKYYERNRFEE